MQEQINFQKSEGQKKFEELARENKEKILSNLAFKRFAGGFELYQKLINREDSSATRDLIISRMRELYKPRPNSQDVRLNEAQNNLRSALLELILSTLRECEEKKFDANDFAEKISAPPLYDLFSAEWNRSATEVEKDSGMIHVNECIAYKQEKDGAISLHIRPVGIKSNDLWDKWKDGVKSIKELIKSGKISANKVIMKSWLLSRDKKAEKVSPDDDEYDSIQFLALQYNQLSLKNYLETGNKPEVRQIIMTKDEFLRENN